MLTNAQLTVLKADILADATLAPMAAAGNQLSEIAAIYNETAAPAFVVWRTSVGPEDWDDAIMGTTGAATQLDGLTASKRDSLFWATGKMLNPSIASVRAALMISAARRTRSRRQSSRCRSAARRGRKSCSPRGPAARRLRRP